MPEQSAYDIAMKFVLKGGGVIYGESAMQKMVDDPFMMDFRPISAYDEYSNFFEVKDFSFDMTLEPQDAASAAPRTSAGPANRALPPAAAAAAAGKTGASSDPFARWRSATEDQARKMKFNLKFKNFSFSRVIDAASPIFFQNCCTQKRFESAALVKRVSVGMPTAGITGSVSPAFMRMDFKDILLTSIHWDDGDLVTESCDFECNWMSFQYRQQLQNGKLMPPQTMTVWDRKADSSRSTDGSP